MSERPMLHVVLNGRRHPIDVARFVIGRDRQGTHLCIPASGLSRRHAEVVFSDGRWIIADLGSTCGIELNGERIERRCIEEGDTVYLGDYALRFTYR